MILFLGENGLSGAGRYLAGALRWAKQPFRYRPDGTVLPSAWMKTRYRAVILSDYQYRFWTAPARRWLLDQVEQKGTGLLMVGGWGSFTGSVGGYAGTDLERLLPVRCIPGDDRVNRSALLDVKSPYPIVVNGFHRARVKPTSQTHLSFRELIWKGSRLSTGKAFPAWVSGHAGHGRTGAFLTDLAPHWAGGLVDWGSRVTVRGPGAFPVEVGKGYLQLIDRLVKSVSQR